VAVGEWDRFRRLLMYEPRGHVDMYGALIVPPVSPTAVFGVLFMHNEGYSTGCGHATIALAKLAVELGWVSAQEPVTRIDIDAPSGLLKAYARVSGGKVVSSGFENVASFAPMLGRSLHVTEIGDVTFDLGYGGAFYAYVDADKLGLTLEPNNAREIAAVGMSIKKAVAASFPVEHPDSRDLSYLYGTIFYCKPQRSDAHSRHVCVFADGAIDRSPTGTGVSGRVAIIRAQGLLNIGQPVLFESITGECFQGRVLRDCRIHDQSAVIPEVEGTAFITGRHEFILEQDDPLTDGFLLR